jgi:MFS transporter, FSR family, fosmidomycin resistance protein
VRKTLRNVTAVKQPRTVSSVSLGHGVNEFFSVIIPPIIPLLVSDLGISYAQAGFLLTVFFLMYSVFQLPAGLLADRIGKKRLLVAGFAGMSGAIILASVAISYEMLIFAQVISGVSGSTFHPAGMSLISDVESDETEGKAMGVFGFGGMVGTMASPVVVGGIAVVAGWRIALAAAAVLGVTVTIVFIVAFDDEDERTGKRSESALGDGGRPQTIQEGFQFIRRIINVPLTSGVLILLCVTILVSIQSRAIQTFTTAYIADGAGAGTSVGNLGFFALLLGGSISSLWAGDLADRFDRGTLGVVAGVGTAILVAATLLVPTVAGTATSWILLIVLSLWFFAIGAVMYACVPVKNALISEEAEQQYSGSLFGVVQTSSAAGSAIGPSLLGAVATNWGVAAAYPAIAAISLLLAGLFGLLSLYG